MKKECGKSCYNKFLGGKTLSQVQEKPLDSPFWKGFMSVKLDFFARGTFVLGNGEQIRFWEDRCLNHSSLADEYPSLYNCASNKNSTVAHVLNSTPIKLPFRRILIGNLRVAWLDLVERLMRINLLDEPDMFRWSLTTNGIFSVKSYHLDLINGHAAFQRGICGN